MRIHTTKKKSELYIITIIIVIRMIIIIICIININLHYILKPYIRLPRCWQQSFKILLSFYEFIL